MKIEDLSFAYGDKIIFKDLSLDLDGKLYSLTGDSGVGKTTLLKLIGGLLLPDKGRIIDAPATPSFMFQEDRLLPWINVRKNISLVTDDTEKMEELLRTLDIDGDLMPSELSGGMARRVALIRALCYRGDALLLDEPFNGMDEKLTDKCIELILKEDKFTVVSAHQSEVHVKLGSQIIHL